MSNTQHAKGVPAAFANPDVPPSQDVAEHGLAQVIGQVTAYHLAGMLGKLLPQMPWQPDCFFCVAAAKKLVRDHQVAIANAQAAGEELPGLPPPPAVNRSITQVIATQLVQTPAGVVPASGSVWACWEHIDVPAEAPRLAGLVNAAGQPIISRK